MTQHYGVDARVTPAGGLDVLSRKEVKRLSKASSGDLYELFRRCSVAVLNSGSLSDDAEKLLALYRDFSIQVVSENRGVKLQLSSAPDQAFVDGVLIEGIREHLFAVLRDIVYVSNEIYDTRRFDLNNSSDITHAVFNVLRNTHVLRAGREPNIAVCWGGHSINRIEYDYTKQVGYELGLRGIDICTGCGPGAMKGPMKGAAVAHAKQRIRGGRYIGITEPGIIAAESPNPMVNELIIMPDIEKRLEAFVRVGHGVIVFPGGVGTCEEILFLLGVLLHPDNAEMPFPLILTGPASSRAYFDQIEQFLDRTIGREALRRVEIIIDDPELVSKRMREGFKQVQEWRETNKDAFHFNWRLRVDLPFQQPFLPSHEAMAALNLHSSLPAHELAANLRRAFSGIVAGNVKAEGVAAIREHGPFKIHGEAALAKHLDQLLASFVEQDRMKLPGDEAYAPCYRVVA